MKMIEKTNRVRCFWDDTNVVVDFEPVGRKGMLLLTQREAGVLANQIWVDITRASIEEESLGYSGRHTFDVCGIPCTSDEAVDLLCDLDCLLSPFRERDWDISECEDALLLECSHSEVDWLHEGF